MFKMNYIKSNTYESSTLAKIQNDITKVSKQLDSESSLVWLYHAHGKEDGTFIAGETVNTDHIIEALKKGRTNDDGSVKPPFKRLVILAFSCFSNQFIFQFQKALEKLETPLFEEGIYLASSDSTRVTLLEYSFEMFAPILMLLRDQQFVGCKIRNRDYSKSYEVINNDFFRNQFSLKNLNLYLDQISKDKKITQEEALKMIIEHESFNKKNPTFNDLVPILNKLREYEQNAISFDMNISFTDGKNKKESSTSSIFPPIENCN